MMIPTPCHIIDLDRLRYNLNQRIKKLRQNVGCTVLLAIKGFSADTILPYMQDYLDGISASGAFEARLGKNVFHKCVCTFSPAYQKNTINDIVKYSDKIVFNSMNQYNTFSPLAISSGCSCGIRINPEYSELPIDFGPNPCQKYSRLGIKKRDMPDICFFREGHIEGIHLHTMCEQNADVLERTINILTEQYDSILKKIKWLNLGGGQMYSDDSYDLDLAVATLLKLKSKYNFEIIIEPCEGIMTQCGFLVTTVVDIIHNEMNIAILDTSGICHFPDAVYRGWRHDIKDADEPGKLPYTYRLAGPSCYAGDIWGDYSFSKPLERGQHIVFLDTAPYSMVKNNTFNGIPMPTLAVYDTTDGLTIKKQYDYDSFLRCQ